MENAELKFDRYRPEQMELLKKLAGMDAQDVIDSRQLRSRIREVLPEFEDVLNDLEYWDDQLQQAEAQQWTYADDLLTEAANMLEESDGSAKQEESAE